MLNVYSRIPCYTRSRRYFAWGIDFFSVEISHYVRLTQKPLYLFINKLPILCAQARISGNRPKIPNAHTLSRFFLKTFLSWEKYSENEFGRSQSNWNSLCGYCVKRCVWWNPLVLSTDFQIFPEHLKYLKISYVFDKRMTKTESFNFIKIKAMNNETSLYTKKKGPAFYFLSNKD